MSKSTAHRLLFAIALVLAIVLTGCEAAPMLTPEERAAYAEATSSIAGLEAMLEGQERSVQSLRDDLTVVRDRLASGELSPAEGGPVVEGLIAEIAAARAELVEVASDIDAETKTVTQLEQRAAERQAEELSAWAEFLPPGVREPVKIGAHWLGTALGAAVLFRRSRQNIVENVRERGLLGLPAGLAKALGWQHSHEDPAKLAEVASRKAAKTSKRIVTASTGDTALVPKGSTFSEWTDLGPDPVWSFFDSRDLVISTASPDQGRVEAPPGAVRIRFGPLISEKDIELGNAVIASTSDE